MNLFSVITKFDEKMDQISWNVFLRVDAWAKFAACDVSPNKSRIVFIAGFGDKDGMGVEVIIVESAQMKFCELFHDFKAESHAYAGFVNEGASGGKQGAVIGVLNVFHNDVSGFDEAELSYFSAGEDCGDLDADALEESSICDIVVASGEA